MSYNRIKWAFNADTMSALLNVFEFCCVLAALVGMVFLFLWAVRGRRVPVCFACGASKVRLSHSVDIWEKAGRAFFIRSFRCAGCQVRFHAFSLAGGSKYLLGTKTRGIKIVFQFRDGFRVAIRSLD